MSQSATVYRPHARYFFFAAGSLGLATLFGWNLLRTVAAQGIPVALEQAPGDLFFFLALLGVTLWYLRLLLSRVYIEHESVTLVMPFARGRTVAYQQLAGVSTGGRFSRAITILYHPRLPNGLLDLDDLRSLILPELNDQDPLLVELETRVPS